MVNREIVQRKLIKLKEYLQELATFRNISYSEYVSNFHNKRTVERLIQLIVDVAVDINSHVLVDEGFPPPRDAFESFIKAVATGVFSLDFARAIAPSTGERNIIVHEYEAIDDGLVFDSINETLEMYNEYIKCYQAFLINITNKKV